MYGYGARGGSPVIDPEDKDTSRDPNSSKRRDTCSDDDIDYLYDMPDLEPADSPTPGARTISDTDVSNSSLTDEVYRNGSSFRHLSPPAPVNLSNLARLERNRPVHVRHLEGVEATNQLNRLNQVYNRDTRHYQYYLDDAYMFSGC